MTVQQIHTNIAELCGVNAAVACEILWDHLNEQIAGGESKEYRGYDWCRCSQLMIAVLSDRVLTEHMVKDALQRLIEKSIIRKDHFNESKFDRTNWYAFTEYGMRLMMEGEEA